MQYRFAVNCGTLSMYPAVYGYNMAFSTLFVLKCVVFEYRVFNYLTVCERRALVRQRRVQQEHFTPSIYLSIVFVYVCIGYWAFTQPVCDIQALVLLARVPVVN